MLFMTLCSLPRDGWQSYEYAVSKPRQISYFFHSFSISNAYIGGGHWASGCHGTTTNVTTMCFWYQCILWDNNHQAYVKWNDHHLTGVETPNFAKATEKYTLKYRMHVQYDVC